MKIRYQLKSKDLMMGHGKLKLLPDELEHFCPWIDDYLVGIQKMDKQHKALLSTLSELHNVLITHGDQALIDKGLFDLIYQTKVHFNSEEKLMQEHDYPDYSDHKELHVILLQQIESVLDTQQELESYHIQQSWAEKLNLADFLRAWFTSHILDEDKKLGDFLKSKKVE